MLSRLALLALGARIFLGTEFQQTAQLSRVKIEQQLAGLGVHRVAFQFHANLLP